MRVILGGLVIAGLLVGCGGSAASEAPEPSTASAAPSTSGTFGGTVTFQSDGAPATTEVAGVVDGAGVSGTAVTTFSNGTHTVQVECAVASPGGWAVAGTVESSTLPGESAGVWSAVIVRDGAPPRVGIWRSEDKQAGGTCDDFLTSFDPAELDPSAFSPVQSGELVPPG